MAFHEGLASAVSYVDVSGSAPHTAGPKEPLMDGKGPLRAVSVAFL